MTLDDGRRMCSRRSRPGPSAHQGGQSDGTWSGIGKGVAVVRDVAKYSLLRYLLMNHVLGLVWACCGPSTTQAHGGAVRAWLSNKVVVAIAITRSNCQGHAGPVNKGSIQREAGYTTRHASILCASMSPSGGWRDWEAHRHRESRECQFRRQPRELRKEESQACVEVSRANGVRGKPPQLVGERLNSRDGVLPWNAARWRAPPRLHGWDDLHGSRRAMLFRRLRAEAAAAAAGDVRQ